MSRKVITRSQLSSLDNSAQQDPDSYSSKIVKLVPADIISLYLGLATIVKAFAGKQDGQSQPGDPARVYWGIFILILVLTPWYLKRTSDLDTKQIVISMASFAVWALSLGQLVSGYWFGYPAEMYISLLVPVYTLVIPAAYKKPN